MNDFWLLTFVIILIVILAIIIDKMKKQLKIKTKGAGNRK